MDYQAEDNRKILAGAKALDTPTVSGSVNTMVKPHDRLVPVS
jgi:hypothetical protein